MYAKKKILCDATISKNMYLLIVKRIDILGSKKKCALFNVEYIEN